jgi:geranylgeranyl reductase family protein
MDKFDCIVVGAGPAGATVARQTALKGLKTLLVEKELLPRYKTCGGAIPAAVERILDVDFGQTLERVATGVTFLSRNDEPCTYYPDGMKVYLVSRDAFDFRLVEEAGRSGAEVMEGTAIRSLEETEKLVKVTTDKGKVFSGTVVVGADGARSVVAKAAGLQGPAGGFSVEGELYPAEPQVLEKHEGRVLFGFGFVGNGYGWVFPKKDHFSVGVGTLQTRLPGMASLYEQFKGSFDYLEGTLEKVRRGWFLPLNRGSRRLNTRQVCLVGDAASLVDPLSGEGIYYAILSGLIAADTICTELPKKGRLSDRYTDRINEDIVKDFFYARKLAALFFKAPSFFYRRNRVVRAYTGLANRDVRYRNLFKELLIAGKGQAGVRQMIRETITGRRS